MGRRLPCRQVAVGLQVDLLDRIRLLLHRLDQDLAGLAHLEIVSLQHRLLGCCQVVADRIGQFDRVVAFGLDLHLPCPCPCLDHPFNPCPFLDHPFIAIASSSFAPVIAGIALKAFVAHPLAAAASSPFILSIL